MAEFVVTWSVIILIMLIAVGMLIAFVVMIISFFTKQVKYTGIPFKWFVND